MNRTRKFFAEICNLHEVKNIPDLFRPGDKSGITLKITRKTNAR